MKKKGDDNAKALQEVNVVCEMFTYCNVDCLKFLISFTYVLCFFYL